MRWIRSLYKLILPLFALAFYLPFLVLLTSCDGPIDRRKVRVGNTPSDSAYSSGSSYGFNDQNGNASSTNTNNSTIPSSGSGNNTNSSVPVEFSNCQIPNGGYSHYHSLIGEFNLCKSNTSGSNKILLQTKNSITDYRLCLYPTNDDAGEGSVMIGGSRCLFSSAGQMQILEFSINRQSFTERRLTGVIIVKDMPYGEVTPYHNDMVNNPPTYSNAYEDCMNYIFNTGDSYACQRFKDKGKYIYVTL